MNLRINIPVLLISTSLFFYACQNEKPVQEKKKFSVENNADQEQTNPNIYTVTATQFANLEMELGTASINNLSKAINAAGYIEVPQESKAEVRSYIGGYLQSSPLLPGDYVKKGQFLISLENLEYIQLQQDYLQAKEELIYLKAVYERQKVLAGEKITSQNSKQQAESKYNSALANFEGLRKKLQLINFNPDKIRAEDISSSINLYAPIEGYITMVNAVKGKFAEPTDVIFEIINTDHLHIELKVYEQDILKVRKGQKISFRVPEADDKIYLGEVFLVGKTIDETDRTVTVHCHIADDSRIPAVIGMYIEAEIYIESREGFCLPSGAFVSEEGEYSVFVVESFNDDEYVFEKIKVEVGQINEDCIEIVGTSPQTLDGKQLLIEGAFDL